MGFTKEGYSILSLRLGEDGGAWLDTEDQAGSRHTKGEGGKRGTEPASNNTATTVLGVRSKKGGGGALLLASRQKLWGAVV